MVHEILIYHELMDRQIPIGPKLKGYIYEEDPSRVIGLLYEYIEGRHPTKDDFWICEEAVQRLHSLGIYHGDLHRDNILILPTGEIKFIDFDTNIITGDNLDQRIAVDKDVLKIKMEEELAGFSEKFFKGFDGECNNPEA